MSGAPLVQGISLVMLRSDVLAPRQSQEHGYAPWSTVTQGVTECLMARGPAVTLRDPKG